MKLKTLASMFIALFAATLVFASNPPKFFRLELVEYSSEEPTEVKLRIPFTMVSALRPTLQDALDDVHLGDEDIDLRAIWEEVKAVGPHDFLEVKSKDGDFKVSTTQTHLVILAEETDEGAVTIRFPLSLGELLLGARENVDVDLLLEELAKFTDEDLMTIEGDRMELRAWIE